MREALLLSIKVSGLKKTEVARLAGISDPFLHQIISGVRRLPVNVAVLLEAVLPIRAEDLLSLQVREEIRAVRKRK